MLMEVLTGVAVIAVGVVAFLGIIGRITGDCRKRVKELEKKVENKIHDKL